MVLFGRVKGWCNADNPLSVFSNIGKSIIQHGAQSEEYNFKSCPNFFIRLLMLKFTTVDDPAPKKIRSFFSTEISLINVLTNVLDKNFKIGDWSPSSDSRLLTFM